MSGKGQIGGWTINNITAYYFLLTIANTFIISHVEGGVAESDIRQGDLVRYLLRPFPYYWIKFFEEIPYRLLQGSYGVMLLLISIVIWGNFIKFSLSIEVLLLGIIMIILAIFISFSYKLSLGLTAFWLKDSKGLHSTLDIIAIVLGGVVAPLQLFPEMLQKIAYATPFPYIIYFPIMALQSKYPADILLRIISIQFFWLSLLLLINRIFWNKGIKIFTAAGQ